MRRSFDRWLMLALLLPGCGEEEAKKPDEGGSSSEEKVGTFTVRLVAPGPATMTRPASSGHATIGGTVFSAPQPQEIVWEEDMKQGDCRLLIPRVPFCEMSCADGVCVEDDVCQANPEVRPVGNLTVTGLKTAEGASEFTVKGINGSYSTPGDVSLPHPPFAEGDEVRVKAAGEGTLAAFELTAKGIAPLELTNTELPLRKDMPLALTWKPGQAGVGRIEVKLDISHHGGTKGKIECDAGDSGSLDVGAGLVTKLLDLGVAGYPTITVARVSRGSTQTSGGRVELQVISDVERAVDIEGLQSCTSTSECTGGKTCQADLTCK